MMRFEVTQRANVHRGVYSLAEEATEAFEAARRTVADFIGAQSHEVSFVPSTTYGMHMAAEMLAERLGKATAFSCRPWSTTARYCRGEGLRRNAAQ